MTEQQQRSSQQLRTTREDPTAWVGWVLFAGIMLILVGSFQAIAGLVALFNDDVLLVVSSQLIVDVDYTAWGWVHLALGGLAVAAGFGVMAGRMWARVFAIMLACVSAIVNLGFLSAYPIWATIMIALDVIVIWALAVHGREVRLD